MRRRHLLMLATLLATPAFAGGDPVDTRSALDRALAPTSLASKAVVVPTSLDAIAKPLDAVAHATPPMHRDAVASVEAPVAAGGGAAEGGKPIASAGSPADAKKALRGAVVSPRR